MEYLDEVPKHYHRFIDWYSAGGEGPYKLWLYGGLASFALFLVVFYYAMRKLLGHRKFRGTWYNEHQYQELLRITYEDQQRGYRVMKHDEIRLLRQWELGHSKGFGRDTGWHF